MLLAVKSTAFKPSQPENGNCKSIFALAFVVALKRVESFIAPQWMQKAKALSGNSRCVCVCVWKNSTESSELRIEK